MSAIFHPLRFNMLVVCKRFTRICYVCLPVWCNDRCLTCAKNICFRRRCKTEPNKLIQAKIQLSGLTRINVKLLQRVFIYSFSAFIFLLSCDCIEILRLLEAKWTYGNLLLARIFVLTVCSLAGLEISRMSALTVFHPMWKTITFMFWMTIVRPQAMHY